MTICCYKWIKSTILNGQTEIWLNAIASDYYSPYIYYLFTSVWYFTMLRVRILLQKFLLSYYSPKPLYIHTPNIFPPLFSSSLFMFFQQNHFAHNSVLFSLSLYISLFLSLSFFPSLSLVSSFYLPTLILRKNNPFIFYFHLTISRPRVGPSIRTR